MREHSRAGPVANQKSRRLMSHGSDIQQEPLDTQNELLNEEGTKKKRVPLSKKKTPGYCETGEGERKLADFIKEYQQLYDKKHREWLKWHIRTACGTKQDSSWIPHATGAQCERLYESMHIRGGKILNREKKSGTGPPKRTASGDLIMEASRLLIQQTHSPTRNLASDH
ncbi:hypothetical protein PoB_000850900 [Plakobranchus ocellatus]|uniref:Uncharacterized protein n=1 Tax=Plakobranchus ocellatus TaxID=259542 RepID=A0AAV3YG67_9GAST|nr:hypothetical protein PoB_000850900 [Plakobranchus ocellatus]